MIIKKFVASECGAVLDSDVKNGGGTDDTAVLQGILDMAQKDGVGVHLVMDGAALITGLEVYSNTTIECPSKSCGFFLANGSDCALFTNARKTSGPYEREKCFDIIEDENIIFEGGTYNHNCRGQKHDVERPDGGFSFTVAFCFRGREKPFHEKSRHRRPAHLHRAFHKLGAGVRRECSHRPSKQKAL